MAFLEAKGWFDGIGPAAKLLEIDFSATITSLGQEFDKNSLRDVIVICSGDRLNGTGIKIEVDSVNGQLMYYFRYGGRNIQGVDEDKLMTQDAALRRALEFTSKLQFEVDTTSPTIYAGSGEWNISFDRRYEGFKCQSRGVELALALSDGRFNFFVDKPAIKPERLVSNIDKESAVDMALAFLVNKTGKVRGEITIRRVEQTISLTTGPWTKDGPQTSDSSREIAPVSRLVWDIGYETTEHDTFWVLIDCETGETYAPYIGM